MGRWTKENNIEYNGINIGRRDIIETISYENAYLILEYAKYVLDTKGIKKTESTCTDRVWFIYAYAIYVYHELGDKNYCLCTEQDVDNYIMYLYEHGYNLNGIRKLVGQMFVFYEYLIKEKKIEENPFYRIAKMYNKSFAKEARGSKVGTNHISDEQVEIIKNTLSNYLVLYSLFTLSTAAKLHHIQFLKWCNIDFEKRYVYLDEDKLYFNTEVAELLLCEQKRRIENNLDDCGYVFRSNIEQNYNKDIPIYKGIVSRWCAEIGNAINIPNLRHLDFRHTAIKNLLSASGSLGMTSLIMNYPWTSAMPKFICDDVNNELLQEYKEICDI